MSTFLRLVRMVTAGSFAVTTLLAGCSDGDGKPGPDGGESAITVAMMQAGVLQPADVGQTWKKSAESPSPNSMIALCGGLATRPPVPGTPSVVASSIADEGEQGAQAFDQVGLVYPDARAAETALAGLRTAAAACPPTASASAGPRGESVEAAYTETTTVTTLNSGEWSGFVVVRHKVYQPANTGSADTAVAVLGQRNAVVVASYAVYWVGAHSTGPEFTSDWRRIVGTVLSRVDAKRGG